VPIRRRGVAGLLSGAAGVGAATGVGVADTSSCTLLDPESSPSYNGFGDLAPDDPEPDPAAAPAPAPVPTTEACSA